MVMDRIFGILLIGSLFWGMAFGRADATAQALFSGASGGITLCLGLAGSICLWSGLMKILERSGLLHTLGRILSRPLSRLFVGVKRDSEAMRYITLNLLANFLGLANAATPFGLRAMEELSKINGKSDSASDAMCMLVVLNTASIQLIPATLIALRMAASSQTPTAILLPIWCASAAAAAVGVCLALLLRRAQQW